MTKTRDRMLDATASLLRKRGYHGTGLADILASSRAPRGSMYFHFPGGKEQLACEAIRASGDAWKERISEILREVRDPADAIDTVCMVLADDLESSGWELGCPIATVALEAAVDSEALRKTASDHFKALEAIVVDLLEHRGIARPVAEIAATTALASIEGALLLARVHRSREPLERVGTALRAQLAMMTP